MVAWLSNYDKNNAGASKLLLLRLDAPALSLVHGPELSQARCAAERRGLACRAGAGALVGGAAAGAEERRRATAAALQQFDELLVAGVKMPCSILRRGPSVTTSSSRVCAGSEQRGAAVAVTVPCCKVERCEPIRISGVNLCGAHLQIVRAPNEQRHTGKVTLESGVVEAGEGAVVARRTRGPCSQQGLHHGVISTLARNM